MSQEQARQFLMQGIEAARAGNKDEARGLFQNTLRLDPQNEAAWLWMSSVARDNRERLFCLQNVLQINPQNETALKSVQALGVDPATLIQQAQAQSRQTAAPVGGSVAPSSAVPALPADHLNAILPQVDEFMRNYQPLPMSAEETEWGLKSGLRYGEALARRRQVTRYAVIGGAGLLILACLIGIAALLLGGEDAGLQIASRPTLTPSFTPTHTATATPGVTNTPSPEPANPVPTFAPPAGLPRGNPVASTVTPVFPNVSAGLGQEFGQAVEFYSIGQYDEAFPVFVAEQSRLSSANQCDPVTYYFHIIGLAEQGGRANLRDARALYEQSLGRTGTDCDNSPVLYAAACFTDYRQYIESPDEDLFNRAMGWCTASLDEMPSQPIVLAATTLARLHLLAEEPDYLQATSILQRSLVTWPADLNLLLTLADVELARGDLNNALNYISQALYVDPVSEPALQKRVEAYLTIAAGVETSDSQRSIQLYGTAVIWSQEYLIFYPGAPEAYVLLARARIGENNLDLAENALTQVIEVRHTLPERNQAAVRQAYDLRANIEARQYRYQEALADIEVLLQTTPNDLALIRRQSNYAYNMGRYALALEGLNSVLASDTLSDSERNTLEMRRLRITAQICTFLDEIACDYETALATLTDDFIAGLENDNTKADARSYRAQARYRLAAETASPQREYELALTDLNQAISQQENAVSQYYRGLILEALNRPDDALAAYDWIVFWASRYHYPFIEDVQARIEELRPDEETT